MSKIILAVDAGHGTDNKFNVRKRHGYDPGVVGFLTYESRVALAWSLTTKEILEKEFGINVVLTRHSDGEPTPLESRTVRARAAGATHFLSIHCNGASPLVRGTETVYRSNAGLGFARKVQGAAMKAVQSKDRGVKQQSAIIRAGQPLSVYVLNNFTSGPACLVELGFLSNLSDRNRLLRKVVRIAFARELGKALSA